MTHNRQLALIRKLCGLGLPAQTLAPSLLPALRELIPSHSAAVFWVDARCEMTGLYAERLLPPEAMARYYENHYQHAVTGFPMAFAARVRATDPVSARKLTKTEQSSDYFRDVLARLDAYQILYGVLRDGPLPIGQISFYRGARDAEFGRREQSVLRGLLRYLAAGLRPQPLSPPRRRRRRSSRSGSAWWNPMDASSAVRPTGRDSFACWRWAMSRRAPRARKNAW